MTKRGMRGIGNIVFMFASGLASFTHSFIHME